MAADREARRRLAPQTQNPSSLAPRALRRQTPKVGAVCGKAARTDLCGGTGATRFPTAITEYKGGSGAIRPEPRQQRGVVSAPLTADPAPRGCSAAAAGQCARAAAAPDKRSAAP